MRGRPLSVVLLGAALATVPLASQTPARPTSPARAAADADFSLPPDFPPDPPPASAVASEPLPRPSVREPFAIGEALHVPARVPDGVMSLLSLMNIGVIADNEPMQRVQPPMRLRLREAEVRRLIDMGVEDAGAVAGMNPDAETYTFADLHAGLSPILGGMTADALAERYSRYYSSRADSLVAQVLFGQPIETDTELMRTQIWLMIADAVMMPATTAAGRIDGPRLVLASHVLQSGGRGGPVWGNNAILPDRSLASPDPSFTAAEWRELLVRLSLAANRTTFTITPQDAATHEGHGGAGAPVVVRGQLNPSAPPIVSSTTGRTLLMPRPPGARNISAIVKHWVLEEHGTVTVPDGGSVPLNGNGAMQVTFTPRAERARTRTAPIMTRLGGVLIHVPAKALLDALYPVPAAAQGLTYGSFGGGTFIDISWHPVDALEVLIRNDYGIALDGGIGEREGVDIARLILEKQADGSYRGSGTLSAKGTVRMPGAGCGRGGVWVNQRATVMAKADDSYDSSGVNPQALWEFRRNDPAPSEKLRLEFTPLTKPVWHGATDPCLPEIQMVEPPEVDTPYFVPLNDARWTVGQTSGVQMVAPAKGTMKYKVHWLPDGASEWKYTVSRVPN